MKPTKTVVDDAINAVQRMRVNRGVGYKMLMKDTFRKLSLRTENEILARHKNA